MRRLIRSLVRWVHCEPPAVNVRRHSLIRWLVFHGGIE